MKKVLIKRDKKNIIKIYVCINNIKNNQDKKQYISSNEENNKLNNNTPLLNFFPFKTLRDIDPTWFNDTLVNLNVKKGNTESRGEIKRRQKGERLFNHEL